MKKFILSPYVMLLAAAAIIMIRVPQAVQDPRFWAEEGRQFYTSALEQGWSSMFTAGGFGYYLFITKIAALFATLVPLAHAPAVTMTIALFIQLLPILLIWICAGPLWNSVRTKCLVTLVILFVSPSSEIWLTTTNSQFHLCLVAAIIALSDIAVKGRLRLMMLGILLLCGLSGALSLFLLPVFAFRAFNDRSLPRWHQVLVLCLCGAIQASFFMIDVSKGGVLYRFEAFDLPTMILVTWHQNFLTPLLGNDVARISYDWFSSMDQNTPHYLAGLVGSTVTMAACFFFAIRKVKWINGYRWPLLICFVLLFFGTYFSMLPPKNVYLIPTNGSRYFYVVNQLFALGLLAKALFGSGLGRRAAQVILATMLLVGVHEYFGMREMGKGLPSWRAEVARHLSDPTYKKLEIWPRGWYVDLRKVPDHKIVAAKRDSKARAEN